MQPVDENFISQVQITQYIPNYDVVGSATIHIYKNLKILTLRDFRIKVNNTSGNFNSAFPNNLRPTVNYAFTSYLNGIVQIWTRYDGIFGCSEIPAYTSIHGELVYY